MKLTGIRFVEELAKASEGAGLQNQRVFIRGDKAINYGRMMEVMGVVIDSGFRQLGLLGEGADSGPTPAAGGKPAAPAPTPKR